MALFEYAPAMPRSAVIIKTAARIGFSEGVVSGWLVDEYVATADTARVNSFAYGVDALTRCCALTIRDAEINSMAFVIFLVALTDRMRLR
jgi:ABC-type proline/glycine betaine transport system substrate-binding protein